MNENLMRIVKEVTGRQTPATSDFDSFNKINLFADLIIKECLDVIRSNDHDSDDEFDRAVRVVYESVRDHFLEEL